MIFTRIVPALLVAAVSAQALYIPDVLYAREFEEFSELSERSPDQQVAASAIREALANMKYNQPRTVRDIIASMKFAREGEEGGAIGMEDHEIELAFENVKKLQEAKKEKKEKKKTHKS